MNAKYTLAQRKKMYAVVFKAVFKQVAHIINYFKNHKHVSEILRK